VLIKAPAGYFDALAEDLRRCGVSDLRRVAEPKSALDEGRGVPEGRPGVIVYVEEPADHDGELDGFVDLGTLLGWPIVPVRVGGGRLRIGPVRTPDAVICSGCAGAALDELDRGAADPIAADGSPGLLGQAAIALVGAQVYELLAGLRVPSALARVGTARIDDLSLESFILTPEDDCPDCFGTPGQPRRPAVSVEEFEYLCGISSAALGGLSLDDEHAVDYRDLSVARRAYRGHRVLALPAAGSDPAADPDPADGGGTGDAERALRRLSHLVSRTAGYRQPANAMDVLQFDGTRRWTASGGGLASVELYVLARDLEQKGSFAAAKYDDLQHAMVFLPAPQARIRDVASLCGVGASNADDPLIVLVSASWRLGRKYGEFARRLAHLDAGCATVQLAVSGRAAGYDIAYLPSWPRELAELLGLRPRLEQIVALARLHDPTPAPTPATA
jgi:SagB-type dehydrogenase family enzyme